jgi:hypothetical protein
MRHAFNEKEVCKREVLVTRFGFLASCAQKGERKESGEETTGCTMKVYDELEAMV